MNINELMQLLQNQNSKYDLDNDNYYDTDTKNLYKNFENIETLDFNY